MRRTPIVLFVVAGLLFAAVVYRRAFTPSHVHAQIRTPAITFNASDYDPQTVVRQFPPIIKPPHVALEEANKLLSPNELVIGLEINGEARAYPLNMLTGPSREIFNDELGGQSIAATW